MTTATACTSSSTAATETSWTGEVDVRVIFYPTGKYTSKGKEILRRSTLTKIILTRGYDAISFNVTHRNGQTSITDHREKATGWHGTTGAFGTRDPQKAGVTKSYTPSGWASEVERYIGWSEAIALLMEAGCDLS